MHTEVPTVHVSTKEDFMTKVYCKRIPMVLKGIDLGDAPSLWTPDYLCRKCGEKAVKVHVTPVSRMDFIRKNFVYRTLPFDEFVRRANRSVQEQYFLCADEKYYLRSLGNDPRKDVADLYAQFPELADDIKLPFFFEHNQYFSSVFRIGSAQVTLWTHFDVMDNLLVQVTGRKRVVLFSPKEVANLYMVGDKSAVLDIDSPDLKAFPLFEHVVHHSCTLEPGDVLFIPALWFHNVKSEQFGVAVNIFWRHLDAPFYDPKDTYGNKDPLHAQKAMQMVEKALAALDELPEDYRDFYARTLASKISSRYVHKQDMAS